MTLFGIFITYACCWWMVLFMVLPWRVKMPPKQVAGPAASAPVNPLLKRKLLITSLLTIIPTAVLYVVIGTARAGEIYHAGSGDCEPLAEYQSSGDVEAKDGYGTRGKKLSPATITDGKQVVIPGDVYVGIDVPTRDYTSGGNPDLRYSDVYAGVVRVTPEGAMDYNGQPISKQPVYGKGCE